MILVKTEKFLKIFARCNWWNIETQTFYWKPVAETARQLEEDGSWTILPGFSLRSHPACVKITQYQNQILLREFKGETE